jgi:hypothetical protein
MQGVCGSAAGFGTMNAEAHILIGQRQGWATTLPFGISSKDFRHHVYIIGKTGSGKTTLLRNLLVQHITLGHGVGLIDPHGDLAEDLLNYIHPRRTDHLVYFNPGDLQFPVAFNLLANVLPDERHLVASGIVEACKNIWRDSWGPRLEYILYNAISALLECQNTSLLGVNRLLTDESYRKWVIRQIKDPFIRNFWMDEYESYEIRFQREAIAPIQNKLGQFLLNPVIRNILGQVKRKVDIPFTMNSERLFIANLAKGKLGNDKANLLGSLLVTQFQLGAMARTDVPEDKRRDFFLFIDEFQNFSTEAFTSILAEARKYRLSLILSHQFIDQLSPSIQQAIFGNVGTLISFHVGYADAELMEKAFGKELLARQFVDLGRHEIAVSLSVTGENQVPFKAKTFSSSELSFGRRDNLVFKSRERFATARTVVEEKLGRWLGEA